MFRAIRDTKDASRNLFNAEVEQETERQPQCGHREPAHPLQHGWCTDDLGFEYQNIATGYKTRNNEGTVFAVSSMFVG